MSSIQTSHQQLKDYLSRSDWDNAQALWLELAEQFSDQPEFLLLLAKEFADAGQKESAAEFASLISETAKAAGKNHEWLYALKLQAETKPTDKQIRAELLTCLSQLHGSDPRFKSILAVSELDQNRTPLPTAIARIETLLTLRVGTYCQHKSWGLGYVKSFDTTLGQIVVRFAHNPSHAMKLAYAADSLVPVGNDHIEVRKLTDLDGLKRWGQGSRALGFEGMGCIHPLQIAVIHEAFAPSQAEIEKALKIVAAYEDAQQRGVGVVSLGSKMIDPPVVQRALRLDGRARAMGLVRDAGGEAGKLD